MPLGLNAQAILTPGGLAEQFGGLMGVLATAPNERRKIENASADSDRNYQLQADRLSMEQQDRAARNEYRDMVLGLKKDQSRLAEEKQHWTESRNPRQALFDKIPRFKKVTRPTGSTDAFGQPIYQIEEVPTTPEEMQQYFDSEQKFMDLMKSHRDLATPPKDFDPNAPPPPGATVRSPTDANALLGIPSSDPAASAPAAPAPAPDPTGYGQLLDTSGGTVPGVLGASQPWNGPQPQAHPIMAHPVMQADPQAAKLSKMSPKAQASFAAILASGDANAIAAARQRLAQMP